MANNLAKEHGGGTFQGQDDVTIGSSSSGEIAASNDNRASVTVQLLASAPGACRVAGSNVSASKGNELQPGDSFTISTRDAVHAHNPNGSGATFTITEVLAD